MARKFLLGRELTVVKRCFPLLPKMKIELAQVWREELDFAVPGGSFPLTGVASRSRIDPRRGEAKMGMDYFLLARGDGSSTCEGSIEPFRFPVGCSLFSHGGEGR